MAAADVPDEESEEQRWSASLADLIAQVQAEAEPGSEAAPSPQKLKPMQQETSAPTQGFIDNIAAPLPRATRRVSN